MTARHYDLTASAGETLNAGVRFHVAGPTFTIDQAQPGDWIFFKGQPWAVFAVDLRPPGSVRVRLGRGQFWEPDVAAAADTLAASARPATITAARVTYRRNDGTWGPLPFGLAASSTEIRVLPHDEASSAFTKELARVAETKGGPMSFEWQATATFVEVPGVRRLAEGALLIIPATDAVGAGNPLPGTEPTNLFAGDWEYGQNDVIADPGAGHFRADTFPPTPASAYALSALDADGTDRSVDLAGLQPGDTMTVQSKTSGPSWSMYQITEVLSQTALAEPPGGPWYRLAVTRTALGPGTSEPASNDRVAFAFDRAPTTWRIHA